MVLRAKPTTAQAATKNASARKTGYVYLDAKRGKSALVMTKNRLGIQYEKWSAGKLNPSPAV